MKYANFIFVTKRIEHHIERHYEIESNKNFFLQRINASEEFYTERFKHILSIPESLDLKKFLLVEYGSHTSYENFKYLKKRTFISFFRENDVDVPICFRKTMSVRQPINEVKLLKFNNYFMRHGKKLQSLKIFYQALQSQYIKKQSNDDRRYKSNYS